MLTQKFAAYTASPLGIEQLCSEFHVIIWK